MHVIVDYKKKLKVFRAHDSKQQIFTKNTSKRPFSANYLQIITAYRGLAKCS